MVVLALLHQLRARKQNGEPGAHPCTSADLHNRSDIIPHLMWLKTQDGTAFVGGSKLIAAVLRWTPRDLLILRGREA